VGVRPRTDRQTDIHITYRQTDGVTIIHFASSDAKCNNAQAENATIKIDDRDLNRIITETLIYTMYRLGHDGECIV